MRLGRPERQTEDRAQVVLELARDGAVDRPVAGVVDARRELVREQPAVDLEQLEREHADVVELVEQPSPRAPRPRPAARSTAGARETRRIPSRWTFSASGQKRVSPSRPRTATIESSRSNGDELLRELVARRSPPRASTPPLALAVVAEPPRLDDRRQPRLGERAEPRRRDPEPPEELLLDEPVLPELERARRRQRRRARAPPRPGRSRTRT